MSTQVGKDHKFHGYITFSFGLKEDDSRTLRIGLQHWKIFGFTCANKALS